MSSRKLAKFALYALQALLAAGVILISIAFVGGLFYIHDFSRHQIEDVGSEVFQFLRTESVLIFVGTSLLFGIGTIRTYLVRNRETELRKQLS